MVETTSPVGCSDKLALIRAAAEDRELTAFDVRLLILIVDHVHSQKGYAWPSLPRLVEHLNASDSGVRQSIKRLCKLGWLTIEAGRGRGNTSRYRPVWARAKNRRQENGFPQNSFSGGGKPSPPSDENRHAGDGKKKEIEELEVRAGEGARDLTAAPSPPEAAPGDERPPSPEPYQQTMLMGLPGGKARAIRLQRDAVTKIDDHLKKAGEMGRCAGVILDDEGLVAAMIFSETLRDKLRCNQRLTESLAEKMSCRRLIFRASRSGGKDIEKCFDWTGSYFNPVPVDPVASSATSVAA